MKTDHVIQPQKAHLKQSPIDLSDFILRHDNFQDRMSSFESPFFDDFDFVPGQVEGLQLGQSVEQAQGRDTSDLVVVEKEATGRLGQVERELFEVPVTAVYRVPLAVAVRGAVGVFRADVAYLVGDVIGYIGDWKSIESKLYKIQGKEGCAEISHK